MTDLSSLEASLKTQPKKPPIHLWDPKLSGDIDIVIKSNGDWVHEGGLIKRYALVKLFASILRREQDDHYYLVTPVEKWRIQVEEHPLSVIDAEIDKAGATDQSVTLTTNVGDRLLVSTQYPLALPGSDQALEDVPYVKLEHGLTAKLNRPVFYRLAEFFEESEGAFFLLSDGDRFQVG